MQVNYQGNRDARVVLLQIIGEHELPLLEEELSHIKAITQSTDFWFITVQVDSWNDDLSPWVAEPIFGDAAFAGNAEKLLYKDFCGRLFLSRIICIVGGLSNKFIRMYSSSISVCVVS